LHKINHLVEIIMKQTKEGKMQIGDQVWLYLNKSKLHSGDFGGWVAGKIVGFTKKKIKVWNYATPDVYKDPNYPVANYLPKYVKPREEGK